MAKDKKGFILYADLFTVVTKLYGKDLLNGTNNTAELFLTILQYVNDLNPEPKSDIVELVFEPIKLQLKRDLEKFEQVKTKRSEAGKRSAIVKKEKQKATKTTSVESVKHRSTNSTDKENVNVNVSVNVKEKEKEIKTINNKKEFFSSGVWFSTLAVQSNGFKLEAIEKYANEFWEHKKSIDQTHTKIDDIKRHFGNWLKIKLDKVRKEPMGDPNYIYYEWERGGGGVMQKVERHRAKAHFENMKGGGYKAIIKKQ